MDYKQYIENLKARKLKAEKEIVKICQSSAAMVTALAKARIINTRIDAEGKIFGIYSEQYQKRRLRNNLTGEFINFSFTNNMWRTTIPRLQKADKKEIIFVIKPDQMNEFKMFFQNERFGNIMKINSIEKELHNRSLSENINSVIIQ